MKRTIRHHNPKPRRKLFMAEQNKEHYYWVVCCTKVKPSSVKFVLVTLADGVNDQAHCTPRVTRVPLP